MQQEPVYPIRPQRPKESPRQLVWCTCCHVIGLEKSLSKQRTVLICKLNQCRRCKKHKDSEAYQCMHQKGWETNRICRECCSPIPKKEYKEHRKQCLN